MDFLEALFPHLREAKEHMRRRRIVFAALWVLLGLAIGLLGSSLVVYQVRNRIPEGISQEWGVTFSTKYARELGLDWRAAYLAVLDDLGARKLRIPAYWDEIEPEQGVYDFTALDWMLAEAERRNARVMLAVGRRLPRWPECHDPSWLTGADERGSSLLPLPQTGLEAETSFHDKAGKGGEGGEKDKLLSFIRTVVERYREHPAIERWQVENEPFLDTFGRCPPSDAKLLREEIELVRSLDARRKVVVTDSGELSSWIALSYYGDVLGVSLYRIVWNQWFGYFYWPLPSSYYRMKAELNLTRLNDVIITEVQLEPWTDRQIGIIPVAQQLEHFDEEHFHDTIAYAKNTGLSEIYLWGVEWWYWVKLQGHHEFWDMAKEVFSGNFQ